MTLTQAAILGIVQGLTEFLPVSSTSHLVITQNLFGLTGGEPVLLIFDIVVHLGTLLSLFVYFWNDFISFLTHPTQNESGKGITLKMIWLIVLATIPTGIIGLFLRKWMEHNFNSIMVTVWTLLINSAILWSTKWVRDGQKEMNNSLDAIWIGIAQGISILPGISRSGATCATALWLKVKAHEAARFSFLIAIPAILAAALVEIPRGLHYFSNEMLPVLIVGFVSAFVFGYFAIIILFKIMLRGRFHYFAVYTALLAIATWIFTVSR